MFSNFGKGLSVVLLMAAVFVMPLASRADSSGGHYAENGYHPTNDGGNFGIGLEYGEPGTWGATGKIWIDRENAFQPAVKFNAGNNVILQLDYLWHNFDIVHMSETSGELPLYIGLGGNLLLQNSVAIAGRVPVGMSYIFDKRNVPVDIYLQAVPTLWFFTGGFTSFDVYGELGAHFYF
jgi:hypothetical protein